jgi:hypothetical protein
VTLRPPSFSKASARKVSWKAEEPMAGRLRSKVAAPWSSVFWSGRSMSWALRGTLGFR